MPTDRELDRWIDAALSTYSAIEARPGLEQRILANALAECPRRKRFPWAWALAMPSAACLLLFLFFAGRHNSYRHPLETTAAANAPLTTAASPRETPATTPLTPPRDRAIRHKALPRPSTAPQALPKENVFPTPSPLTAEEQTLFAYNRAHLRAATTRVNELDIDPIRIAALQIEPLTISTVELPASIPSGPGRNDQLP